MLSTNDVTAIEVRHYVVMREPEDEVLDYENLRRFVQRVLDALCEQPGRILVDGRRTPRSYTFSEAYRLVQEFKDLECLKTGRIAILGDYDKSFERTQSLEAFAQEAGLHVRAFLDYEAAVAYLTEPGS